MSIYADTQTPSQLTQAVSAIAGFVVARTRQLAQLVKNRRDASMLAGLDDRMLADIGLTRGDLRDAVAEPVWRDPTSILVSRAYERRANRRQTALAYSEGVFSPSIVPSIPRHVSVNCVG